MCLKFPGIKNIFLFYIFSEDVICVQRLLVHRFAFLLSPPPAAVLYLADLEEHILAQLFGSHGRYTQAQGVFLSFSRPACLLPDKVSSTHGFSTSAVFFEGNQSFLSPGTNGNLPERNNYCS